MIIAEDFIHYANTLGFSFYTGVPCSYLTPLINKVISSPNTRYVSAANEGDAVAIASGATLAGQHAVVMMQNSGLGNAVNPLTSLNQIFDIPILLLVTLRGDPKGDSDEPQHQLMGQITTAMLDVMQIKWQYFPEDNAQLSRYLAEAHEYMKLYRKPYALVMRKNAVAKESLINDIPPKHVPHLMTNRNEQFGLHYSRREILSAIQASIQPEDVIIATTGFTGRELFALGDHNNQLYMVGSLGCAASLGLGVALAKPNQRVFVIDADGSALMRLGSFATIGYERPRNLIHFLLDNHVSESTGGQATVSHSIDFPSIAQAVGYENIIQQPTLTDIKSVCASKQQSLTFCYCQIQRGTMKPLPRPTVTPKVVAQRFSHHLQSQDMEVVT